MGEVHRARDTRLDREVALKVLPAAVAGDPERLRRFEQEARAAGALNHPNVLVVHDAGAHDGTPFLVTELLEGQTLRERLRGGPLPWRKAVDVATQVAAGLAAAHDRGIVHRDLKPENLFVTKDGRIKILDFGLARATGGEATAEESTLAATEPGAVLGTAGYMAPEQVRGKPADARADVFALGAVLYEALAGQRAFAGETAVERGYAILNSDPAALADAGVTVPPAVERLVRRCLEKQPEERFQSARDLGFALQALSDASGVSGTSGAPSAAPAGWLRRPLLLGFAALAILLAGVLLGRTRGPWTAPPLAPAVAPASQPTTAPEAPRLTQLTWRRGFVRQARFAPDGKSVIYSAAWDGAEPAVYTVLPGNPESRQLVGPGHELAAVSRSGEVGVLSGSVRECASWVVRAGTLSRTHVGGGAPRAEQERVTAADFLPDGTLALARFVSGGGASGFGFKSSVELPAGTALAEIAGVIDFLRASPDGRYLAWIEHPMIWDDTGFVVVLDRTTRQRRKVGPSWIGVQGLAWAPDGSRLLVTADPHAIRRALFSLSLDGNVRRVLDVPTILTVLDVAPDGRMLFSSVEWRTEIRVLVPGASVERDLTWGVAPFEPRLTANGRGVAFNGLHGSSMTTHIRPVDGGAGVNVDDWAMLDMSGDGRFVLTSPYPTYHKLRLVPTGAGTKRELALGDVRGPLRAWFFPDGNRVLVSGESPAGRHLFVLDLQGGPPRRLAPTGVMAGNPLSPRGTSVLALAQDGTHRVYPVSGGRDQVLKGLSPGEVVAGFSEDDRHVFVYPFTSAPFPAQVDRVEVATGTRRPWRTLGPTDRAGRTGLTLSHVIQDGRGYAYSAGRELSTLFVVEGRK
jgi:hypothetical protein